MARTSQKKRLRRGDKKLEKNCTKKVLTPWIDTMVWSLTQSQTSWSVKSRGLQEALLQAKLVEVMEFQLNYFKSQKMMLLKCHTQYVSKFGKLSSGHRNGKGQFSFQSQRRAVTKKMFKRLINCSHFTHQQSEAQNPSSQVSTVHGPPDVHNGFREGRGTRDQLANTHWMI